MTSMTQAATGNALLRTMAPRDYALLEPHFQRVNLEAGQLLTQAHAPIETLCFPEDGVISLSDIMADGERIGIGIIGFEGLAGWPLLLGSETSPWEVNVAIRGCVGLRIDRAPFLDACAKSLSLNTLLLRFVHALMIQIGRTTSSNLFDTVEQRLARWLLMNQDRLGQDTIELTHKQLGVMLGVRRASVTDTLHLLEGRGMVRANRGAVAITDRAGLQQIVGDSYGFAEAEYARLIAPFCREH